MPQEFGILIMKTIFQLEEDTNEGMVERTYTLRDLLDFLDLEGMYVQSINGIKVDFKGEEQG